MLVFATNRGITRIRGTNYKGPHGLLSSLLHHNPELYRGTSLIRNTHPPKDNHRTLGIGLR